MLHHKPKVPDGPPRSMSHGRGGAGNMSSGSEGVDGNDLKTPTLKQEHYTTGRGGQGNIVSNDNATNARLAQDVDMPVSVTKEHNTGTYHWGRGGEGNMVTLGADKHEKKERTASKGENGHEKPSLLEKASHALGMGHKKE